MVEKRENEANGDGLPQRKKSRFDAPVVPPPGSAAAGAGTAEGPAEKAKRLMELQKKLLEKARNLPQLAKVTGAAAAAPEATGSAAPAPDITAAVQRAAQVAASFGLQVGGARAAPPAVASTAAGAPPGFRPAPLRLDAQGREIDEQGNVIQKAVAPVASLRINQQQPSRPAAAGLSLEALDAAAASAPRLEADPFYDPRVGTKGLAKLDRRRRATFEFVQEGEYQKQAEMGRLKREYGEHAFKKAVLPRKAGPLEGDANSVPIGGGGDPNQVPIGQPPPAPLRPSEQLPPVPEVEWWDKPLLQHGSYEEDVLEEELQLKDNKITHYVEHPVPMEPPAEAPPPPPQPLKLTKPELKKLRTQRRKAREQEKQELIRQGLLEPPKPKVRLANLMRVLGAEATADPTAIEVEVRKQMAERQQAHDDRNEARKLTPAERSEKKLKKLFDDTGVEIQAAVFRVGSLANKLNRIKVQLNAEENHLTGVAVISDAFTLVVVEGCNKSIKRYSKLMLRRIDWSAGQELPGGDDEDDDDHDNGPSRRAGEPANACHLVWQGLVMEAAFGKFKVEQCSSEAAARRLLADYKVAHYWDAAANFVPEDAPAVAL